MLQPIQRLTICPNVKIELLNAQSLTNKSCLIHDHILDKHLDLMCLTETWHKPDMFSVLNETSPPGYHYLKKACSTGRGGGLSVIYRDELDLSPLPLPELSSFECLAFKCKRAFLMTVFLIYRPPKPNPAFIQHSAFNSFPTALVKTNISIISPLNKSVHPRSLCSTCPKKCHNQTYP